MYFCRGSALIMAAAIAIATMLVAGQSRASDGAGVGSGESRGPLLIAAGAAIADYDGSRPAAAEAMTEDAYVTELSMPEVGEAAFLGGSCCEPRHEPCGNEPHAPRFYVGGIIGASFATLALPPDDSINRSLFTAGGTLGMAFDRPLGALRLEVEGRGRDQVSETVTDTDLGFGVTSTATDIWSTTVNLWRDFAPTDQLGVYVGGGLGGGGYRSVISVSEPFTDRLGANDPISAFAWQAGCGITYALTPRATLDLGYRFFAIDESTAQGFDSLSGPFSYRTGFSASELLFTLRIYDPFRGWR
jgi:opacity protein-like surface antigen